MEETKEIERPKPAGQTMVPAGTFENSLEPKTFEQTMNLANLLSKSDIVPKDFQGKPANILIAIGLGREVGFGWAQALQCICVINGRPTIWGDGAIGLILNSDVFESKSDSFDPAKDGGTATFVSKRKGQSSTTRTFSHEDAKKAGLLGKDTYVKYEKRMLFNRARAFALRDDYADVLKGLRIREEEDDFDYTLKAQVGEGGERIYAMPQRVQTAPQAAPEAPKGSQEPKPAPEAAQAQPAQAPESHPEEATDGESEFDVERCAKTTLSDKPAVVIVAKDDTRYYFVNDDEKARERVHKMAKDHRRLIVAWTAIKGGRIIEQIQPAVQG